MLTYTVVRGPGLGQAGTVHEHPPGSIAALPTPGTQLPATGVGYWTRCAVGGTSPSCWVDANGLVHAPGDAPIGGGVLTTFTEKLTIAQFQSKYPDEHRRWLARSTDMNIQLGALPFQTISQQGVNVGHYYSRSTGEYRRRRDMPSTIGTAIGHIGDFVKDALCPLVQSNAGQALTAMAGGAAAGPSGAQAAGVGVNIAGRLCPSGPGTVTPPRYPSGAVTRYNLTRNVWVIYAPG